MIPFTLHAYSLQHVGAQASDTSPPFWPRTRGAIRRKERKEGKERAGDELFKHNAQTKIPKGSQ